MKGAECEASSSEAFAQQIRRKFNRKLTLEPFENSA